MLPNPEEDIYENTFVTPVYLITNNPAAGQFDPGLSRLGRIEQNPRAKPAKGGTAAPKTLD